MLIRFCEEQITLMADIEAISSITYVLTLKDVNALRFLWFPQNDLNQEPEEFQMLVHLFGGRWSQSVSNFALRKTADDNKDLFNAETVKAVHKNFYVDDLLKSLKTVENAKKLYEQLTQMLASGGFHLTKLSLTSKYFNGLGLGYASCFFQFNFHRPRLLRPILEFNF